MYANVSQQAKTLMQPLEGSQTQMMNRRTRKQAHQILNKKILSKIKEESTYSGVNSIDMKHNSHMHFDAFTVVSNGKKATKMSKYHGKIQAVNSKCHEHHKTNKLYFSRISLAHKGVFTILEVSNETFDFL